MKTFAAPDRASLEHHGIVIVEGIMGSGKSTTMRLVAKALEEAGRPVLAIHERADPHPVRATDELHHWFEPWLETTSQGLASRAVSKWASFAEKVRHGAAVPVLDGQLFHGDLTHLFLMEAGFEQLAAYCDGVVRCIAPLRPLVVYLRQEDVERAVRTICTERGDAWVKYQVDWKLKGPLAVRRQLSGLDGLIALYQEYRSITDALFDRLSLDKIVIENSERDWKRYDRQILGRLGLDGAPATCS